MTTAAFTAAGTTLGVSATAPGTFDASGYEALTLVDIGEITDYGSLGRVYNEITHNPVADRATYKFKGSYNEGTMSLTLAKAATDAGQIVLDAALDSDADYYFGVELNDNPAAGTTTNTNTILYFPAKVMSAPNAIGSVDSIVGRTTDLSISGSIVEVAAVFV